MFVEAGMHVDSVNLDGLTAAQLATRKYTQTLSTEVTIDWKK